MRTFKTCLVLTSFFALFWLQPAGAATGPQPEPRLAFDPAANAFQLGIATDPDSGHFLFQIRQDGRTIALREVPGSDSRRDLLRAVMTPDAARVAYVTRSGQKEFTLWAGELADRTALDQFVDQVGGRGREIDSPAWDETGHRLAYRVVHRSGGEVASTEIWVWTWGAARGDLVFAAPGRHELMGWLQGPGRLLLSSPDGAQGELALAGGSFATEADLAPRRPEPRARPLLPRLFAAAIAGNYADIQPEYSSVPTSGAPSSNLNVRIRVYNNGTNTWTPGNNYRLGAEHTGNTNQVSWVAFGSCGGYMNGPTDGRSYMCSGASVPSGSSYDFYFTIRVPASGTQRLAVRMVRDGYEWFGESWYWNITATGTSTNNADIQPANSSVPTSGAPNTNLNVRIRVYNNGTTTWTPGANYRLGAEYVGNTNQVTWVAFGSCGGFMSSPTNARAYMCSGASVPPGGSYDFNFTIRVPASGSQRLAVRMVRDGYEWFGESWYWTITATGGVCPAGSYDVADHVLADSPNHRVFSRVQGSGAQEEFAYFQGSPVGSLTHWFFVKNTGGDNWEEFGYDGSYVYRYRDTSWGNTCNGDNAPSYYAIIDSNRTSYAKWAPRCMTLNQTWYSDVGSRVDAGYKNWNGRCDFACTSQYEGNVQQGTKLVAYYANWTTIWGNSIPNVMELESMFTHEHFWYAKNYGLVGFRTADSSFVSAAYQVAGSGYPSPNWVSLCGQ